MILLQINLHFYSLQSSFMLCFKFVQYLYHFHTGGGVMGMSAAFNLTKFIHPSKICVLEPDPTYVRSASALSWASIRQQFSLAENIKLSQSSIKFIKDIDQYLSRSLSKLFIM